MSFTELMLRNRHAVWALAIAAAIFGLYAYVSIPMQLFPDIGVARQNRNRSIFGLLFDLKSPFHCSLLFENYECGIRSSLETWISTEPRQGSCSLLAEWQSPASSFY